ncbi:helix-turn-helix transcriptional regulator [Nocardioides marmoraquaticus]
MTAQLARPDDVVRLVTELVVGRDGPDGTPRVVVIEGARGAGRTTTLDRVASALTTCRVVRASGVPWEAGSPLATLRHAGLATDLAGRDVVEKAVDLWRDLDGTGGSATVLLVDDADLADPESLQVLATGSRLHPEARVLVVATRTIGGRGAANEVLDRAAGLVLRLAPMTAAEVRELAAGQGVALSATVAAHLVRHTDGNPAHVEALVASSPRSVWQGVAPDLPAPALVQRRTAGALERLPPDARELVEAVAVLGPEAPLALAAAVARAERPLDAVDAAVEIGLLLRTGVGVGTTVSFAEPIESAAVRDLMGLQRRSELHRAAATLVDDEAARLEHAVAARWEPDAALADELHALAQRHAGAGAWSTAAHLYLLARRSSAHPGRAAERLLLAVDALVGAGDVLAASGYLAEVESLPESAMRNSVIGYLAILRGRAGEAVSRLDRAWQLVSARRDPVVAATVAQRHVLHALAGCDGAAIVTWADRAVDVVGPDHPTAIEAQAIRGLGLGATGHVEEALASYRELLGRSLGGSVGQRVGMGAGWLHLVADEVDVARAELSRAVPTDYLGGSVRISLWARAWLARVHFLTGEWDRAVEVAGSAVGLADDVGVRLLQPLLRWTLTQVHALRGDWDRARDSSRAAVTDGAGEYAVSRVPACLGRAALCEAAADYAGVLAALAPLAQGTFGPDVAEPGFWPWADVHANALVVQGDLDGAADFLDRHERVARDRGHRSTRARLGYARGRLLGAQGDLRAARQAFEASLEALQPLPLVYDRARVNFAYGQTLRRAGKRREADVVITAAAEDWLALGATTYVQRCERELKAGGVRAVLRDRPAESLTPQERAVAGMVATGLRNREVAAELFLSEKTVQFHLTRVYAKLGVRSRVELATLPPDTWRDDA